jgi:hypothetical protein
VFEMPVTVTSSATPTLAVIAVYAQGASLAEGMVNAYAGTNNVNVVENGSTSRYTCTSRWEELERETPVISAWETTSCPAKASGSVTQGYAWSGNANTTTDTTGAPGSVGTNGGISTRGTVTHDSPIGLEEGLGLELGLGLAVGVSQAQGVLRPRVAFRVVLSTQRPWGTTNTPADVTLWMLNLTCRVEAHPEWLDVSWGQKDRWNTKSAEPSSSSEPVSGTPTNVAPSSST